MSRFEALELITSKGVYKIVHTLNSMANEQFEQTYQQENDLTITINYDGSHLQIKSNGSIWLYRIYKSSEYII